MLKRLNIENSFSPQGYRVSLIQCRQQQHVVKCNVYINRDIWDCQWDLYACIRKHNIKLFRLVWQWLNTFLFAYMNEISFRINVECRRWEKSAEHCGVIESLLTHIGANHVRQKINNIILPMQFQIRLPLQNSTWYSHICMYNQFDIVYTYI